MTIEIESSPFSSTHYHGGVYTDDNGKEFPFTIEYTVHIELHQSGYETINWPEEVPDNQYEVETNISLEFKPPF